MDGKTNVLEGQKRGKLEKNIKSIRIRQNKENSTKRFQRKNSGIKGRNRKGGRNKDEVERQRQKRKGKNY